jgi:hypothetical protein
MDPDLERESERRVAARCCVRSSLPDRHRRQPNDRAAQERTATWSRWLRHSAPVDAMKKPVVDPRSPCRPQGTSPASSAVPHAAGSPGATASVRLEEEWLFRLSSEDTPGDGHAIERPFTPDASQLTLLGHGTSSSFEARSCRSCRAVR